MAYTKSQLDKMFSELPDDVKEAMTSVDTVDILKEIQEKYHFHLDQIGDLSAEVGMLMLGATPPQRFISNIEKNLNITKEVATEIATTVNEKIFKKVRHSLMELHQMAPTEAIKEEKKEETKPIETTKQEEVKKPAIDPYKEAV
jgi:hypothetical protein